MDPLNNQGPRYEDRSPLQKYSTQNDYPINEEILLDVMRGRILPIPWICDRFLDAGLHPVDFTGQWDGDPCAFLSRGLAHAVVEVAGERFALIRPRDFCRFIESLVESLE